MQLENHSKVDLVHDSIHERIISGDLKIGDQIPTEAELAAEFGCSRGTVSKAIERLAHDGLVERRTRAGTRVIESSVRRSKDNVQLDACAFIYPNEQHEGIWRIVQGFQQAAQAVKRRTMMLTTGTDFRKEAEILGRLGEFDVKGAVVYPVLPGPRDQINFGQMLLKCPFPVVLTDVSLPGLDTPAVVADGFHAGYTMTRHLVEGGAKRIGFLTNYHAMPFMRDRFLGYRQALEGAGIEVPEQWWLSEPGMHPDFTDPVSSCVPAAKRLLQRGGELEGIVCANDFLALGCLRAARELGLRVPEQLKVVGIDDYALSAQSEPSLTTYHIPYEQMGQLAFQMLNRLVQGARISATEVPLRGNIVVRQSG
jgi:GntR family transcriptional regulator of arabinose operon